MPPSGESNITEAFRQDFDRTAFHRYISFIYSQNISHKSTPLKMIRNLTEDDAAAVLEIYRQGLDTGEASFETETPDWEGWRNKYLPFCRLAWDQDGRVLGWAALAAVSARDCYRGVAEVSIYVATEHAGLGIGGKLMRRLIEESERNGIWSLYASIFPENQATRRLHLRHGFREVGIRERIAQRDGRWRDTLMLERRSEKTGN